MLMPGRGYSTGSQYRYGFNGKENDNEVKGTGNQQDYGMRIYEPRLGRFLSVDPISGEFPWNSPYSFAEGDPINFIDLDGLEKAPKGNTSTLPVLDNPLIEKIIDDILDEIRRFWRRPFRRTIPPTPPVSRPIPVPVPVPIPIERPSNEDKPLEPGTVPKPGLGIGPGSGNPKPIPVTPLGNDDGPDPKGVDKPSPSPSNQPNPHGAPSNWPGSSDDGDKPRMHEQYVLEATKDGKYPVMTWGRKSPEKEQIFLKKGEVWKYGTTVNKGQRIRQYTQQWLKRTGLRYRTQERGSAQYVLMQEALKIINYIITHGGRLLPGNKGIK